MYYFDWTATTPITENSLEEYVNVSKLNFGNPSSTHSIGLDAKNKLENTRISISKILGISFQNISFTSGGTESDSIIIQSFLNSPNPGEILISSIEHSAVSENKRIMEKFGWKFTLLPCPNGFLEEKTLKDALNPKVRLVCLMKVNNVTGSILDIENYVKIIRDYEKKSGRKIHIHCDAVQAFGKISFNPVSEGVDSAAFSSHKIGGPKGIGLLYNSNISIFSLSKGGGQEKGLRPGTENLPAICAMNVAIKEAITDLEKNYKIVDQYRKLLINILKQEDIKIISPLEEGKYSPYILCVSVKPTPSEVFLRILSDKGFCVSAGSACSNNARGKAESVLTSMKVKTEDRMSALRISLSYRNTKEEVELLGHTILETYRNLKNGKF